MSKKKPGKTGISYQRRKSLYGYGFIALWFIGACIFFIYPVISSFIVSLRQVTPVTGSLSGPFVGLQNYIDAFNKDEYFKTYLVDVLIDTAKKTPLVLVFSLFIAVIINQKFRGRTFARAVFFLPVIIATGPVYEIITGDMKSSGANTAAQFSTMLETNMVEELLHFLGVYNINDTLTEYVSKAADDIFLLVWNCGVQILVFLAALQTIPASAREAAQMEGATAWEFFWKITFPYVSPMILANLIFTVIDSFTATTNTVMERCLDKQLEWEFGLSSAMVWSYFAVVIIAVGIIFALVSRFVYYEVD